MSTEAQETGAEWHFEDTVFAINGKPAQRRAVLSYGGNFVLWTHPNMEVSDAQAKLLLQTLNSQADLLEACRQAEIAFDLYAMSHRQKGTPEGERKAKENERLAKICSDAIAKVEGQTL